MIDLLKYFDAAYLVNLFRRPDRLQETQDEFEKWGIVGVQRIEAVDGSTLPPHQNISAGALGLYYTHLNIIRHAKQQGFKNVLLLEDDIEFTPNVLEFDSFMKAVPSDVCLLYLGGHHIQKPTKVSERIVRNTQVFTTHSFVIYEQIFDTILNDLEGKLNNQDCQVDLYLADVIQKRFPSYSFFPNMTTQRPSHSDIENRHTDYNDNIHENLDI